jgi:hypothetical protein
MPLTREEILDRLQNPRTPSSSVSTYTGELIRDMKPRRTLRERLRALLRRVGRSRTTA